MRQTPIAWKNLTHQPARTVVSIGGIAFAILLMFMQLGFLGAVGDTATKVYSRLPYDLIVRSPEYLHVYDPRSIPIALEMQLASLPAVASVKPLNLGVTSWQNPLNKEFRVVAVVGIDPNDSPLQLPELDGQLHLLQHPEHVVMDRTSRSDLGPLDQHRFSDADIGRKPSINDSLATIVGTVEMGTGLAANGQVITSAEGFQGFVPGSDPDRTSMLLVHLRDGVEPEAAQQQLRDHLQRLGGENAYVQVLTWDQAVQAERTRWYWETPIGIIFAMGVALAVVVGGVICYMVLAADVLAHLPEYATLKAMGYSNRFLGRVLLSQSALLAAAALPPALLSALALYALTSALAGVSIQMTGERVFLVALLSLVMCSVAGIVALRKLANAEPVNLF